MSQLSTLLHKIRDHGLKSADVETAITESVADVREYVGSPITAAIGDAAADKIETLENAILTAVHAYLVAKLGATFGGLASLMASNAVHSVLDGIELALRGAAAVNDGKD